MPTDEEMAVPMLHGLWRLLTLNWALLVVAAVLGAALGALAAVTTPKEYRATAEVFVNVNSAQSTGDILQGSNYAQEQARNFATVATREVVLEPALTQLGSDATVVELRRELTTSVPLNSSIVSIAATNESSHGAARLANTVAESLVARAKELTPQVDGVRPVELRVIESATPPEAPSSPNVPLSVIAGLLAGLVLGTIAAALRPFIIGKVRDEEQLVELVPASVLGRVSFDRDAPAHPVAMSADAFSRRSEEIRQLRTNLRFVQTGEAHRSFVVTSAVPGEGKSTISANVAAAMAAAGLRTCLVEADLRRPTLGAMLGLVDGIGLTTVVAGDASIDEVTQSWGHDGLDVILAGERPPNPSELLESEHTLEVLESIRARYEVIIIDAPPLLPVTDAVALTRAAGGVILVVGARRARITAVRRAREQLAAVAVPVLGTVFNFVPARRGFDRYTGAISAAGEAAGSDASADPSASAPDVKGQP